MNFFYQSWRDPLLSWNHSEFGGIKTVNVRRYKVWKPDVYLYNIVTCLFFCERFTISIPYTTNF